MTEQVERYDCFQQQTPFGDYVRYTDYAALLDERDRLKEQVEKLIDKCVWKTSEADWKAHDCPGRFPNRESAVAALLKGSE